VSGTSITIRPRDVQAERPVVALLPHPLDLQVAGILVEAETHVAATEEIAGQDTMIPGPIQCGGSLSVFAPVSSPARL